MSKKLTEWFPGDVKPARKGVYERKVSDSSASSYSYWTGKKWMFSDNSPQGAERHFGIASLWQNRAWRGLAYDPEKGLPQ